LLNRTWEFLRATAKYFSSSQAPNSSNNYIPGYTLHYKRIIKEEDFSNRLFQKNASVSDVWQAQFTLRYTLENKNKIKNHSKTIVHKRKIS
jgi:hypothetical protein